MLAVSVLELSLALESFAEAAARVIEDTPTALAVSCSSIARVSPGASVPREQLTVPAP